MASYTSLLRAGICGIAAVLYSGCTLPVRAIDKPKLTNDIIYNSVDQSNLEVVSAIDKTLAKKNDPAKVDLQILVDGEFIERYGTKDNQWWEKCLDSFSFVNERFKKEFNIKFDIDGVEYLKVPAGFPKDLGFIEAYIRLNYTPRQFDAFVFMSGEEYNKGHGATKLCGNHSVIAPDRYTIFLKRVLQHELSHLFNASDAENSKTIMSNHFFNFSYEWSIEEREVITQYKDRNWSEPSNTISYRNAIAAFPTDADRVAAEKLFCYALAWEFHKEGLELAEAMREKYPKSEFVDSAYEFILKLKEKKEKEEKQAQQSGRLRNDIDNR